MAEKIDPLKIARSSRDMDVKGLVGFFYAHQSKFWSWGPHNFVDVKGRGLRFNVQGHHHTDTCICSLMDWTCSIFTLPHLTVR